MKGFIYYFASYQAGLLKAEDLFHKQGVETTLCVTTDHCLVHSEHPTAVQYSLLSLFLFCTQHCCTRLGSKWRPFSLFACCHSDPSQVARRLKNNGYLTLDRANSCHLLWNYLSFGQFKKGPLDPPDAKMFSVVQIQTE